MPNWNSNNLIVQGKPEVVKQFIQENFRVSEDSKNYVLDFEQFDPTPIDLETNDIIKDWYMWRLEHWGSKWSPSDEQCISLSLEFKDETVLVYDMHRKDDKGIFSEQFVKDIDTSDIKLMKLELTCFFYTPWGPPVGIFEQWYKKYNKTGLEATLKFYEPGCCVLGELWFKGEEYGEEYVDYDDRPTWIKYLLDEGWEDCEYYIEECKEYIMEMWEGKNDEARDMLINKVEKELIVSDNEKASKLIASIFDAYYEWLHKGDESDEISEE